MKLNKGGVYTASNVTFNPKTNEATSYGWWKFLMPINGRLVFNAHPYSNSTIKHQHKVRRIAPTPDLVIDSHLSLDNPLVFEDAILRLRDKQASLQALIDRPGTKKLKNIERAHEIFQIEQKIAELKTFQKRGKK